jgi:hypothetical protein
VLLVVVRAFVWRSSRWMGRTRQAGRYHRIWSSWRLRIRGYCDRDDSRGSTDSEHQIQGSQMHLRERSEELLSLAHLQLQSTLRVEILLRECLCAPAGEAMSIASLINSSLCNLQDPTGCSVGTSNDPRVTLDIKLRHIPQHSIPSSFNDFFPYFFPHGGTQPVEDSHPGACDNGRRRRIIINRLSFDDLAPLK